MSNARVIFKSVEGTEVKIQCSTDAKMIDICQKYSNKIKINLYSLAFIYAGSPLNFELSFKDQANTIDKLRNEMNILVFNSENDDLVCPKCGEKINFNKQKMNEIRISINKINNAIKDINVMIESILKISTEDTIKLQLNNYSLIYKRLNEDIKNLNIKFDDLLNNKNIKISSNEELNIINNEINFNNYIIAKIGIKDEDVNKKIKIISSYEEFTRENSLKLKEADILLRNEDEIKNVEIRINDELIPFDYYHTFKSKGKYTIKYSFKNYLKNTNLMFANCKLLININLSNFNTNNVNNMSGMFYECSSLAFINLTNFNTDNVTNMTSMFRGCSSLTNIDLSNINTNNVTKMACMFYNCNSLYSINLSNFNTQNVTDMSGMFYGCSSLKSLDLSNFNTDKVTNMNNMFGSCDLDNINLSNFNTNNVTNMSGMFKSFGKLENINLSNFNTDNVTDMSYMFACTSIKSINLSNFNTNNVKNMCGMFYGCSSLTNINISNFNINNVTDIDGMFGECSSLNKDNIIINDKSIFNNEEVFKDIPLEKLLQDLFIIR